MRASRAAANGAGICLPCALVLMTLVHAAYCPRGAAPLRIREDVH